MTMVVLEKAMYAEESEYTPLASTEPMESTFPMATTPKPRTRKRKDEALRAIRPVDVSFIQTLDGQWLADEKVTLQFGVGVTPKDAIADLMDTLIEYQEVLRARRYHLTPYLLEHLRWLESALA